ncbi:MAG: adenylate/guanylate cyclase domain-containing protein [Verrucomicrobiota bacterium]
MNLPRLDLSKVRHDLRGPINHIVGYSEILLEDETLPPEFAPDVERIRSGGRQLIELISHYLDEYRLQTEPLDLPRLQHDLRTPINHILGHGEMLEEMAIERKLERFVPDLRRIHEAARTWLALMEEILLPLNQPPPESAAPGVVANFTTSGSPVLRPAISFATPPAAPIPVATDGGRILVADDDPGNRDILTRCLERNGYSVTVAANGLEALQRLRGEPFDLALLDILMPGLDGYQVLLKLKGDAALCDIPVIIISGFDLGSGIARCIEAGADDYLTKPFNPVLLRARIAACLDKKRLLDQERALAIQVKEERARSDKLLLSILPAPIADRLKKGENTIVDALDEATVLFADLAGFTELAARLAASETVQLLDEIFGGFDRLAERHGIEKIKTIGDAWMAASGVPRPRADHVEAAAELSLGMLEFLNGFAATTHHAIRVRIGIHSGPVVAGVIGRNRFTYDLWGDTVNTASRMESHGIPGRIHVSSAVAERLKGKYEFESRGPIPVKGLGNLNTLFLNGRCPR